MKIAHIADNHFQKKRLDECISCFNYIIGYLDEQKPDYIFHAGDLFEKNVLINSPEYHASVNAMTALANIAPVYMVRGNHDPIGALEIFQEFSARYPIYYFDEIEIIKTRDFKLLTIPYQIPSTVGSGDSIGEVHVTGAESIRSSIQSFIKSDTNLSKFVLAHISILDSRFANSERIQEGEILLSVDDLNIPELNGVFLGHIHNSQQDIFKDTNIRYAGAHYRTRFDEVMEPGFYMWEFKEWQPSIKFVNTPARDMVQINLGESETKELIARNKFDFPVGADVKIVLEVPQGMNKIVDKERIMKLVPEGTNLDIAIKVNPVIEVRSEKMAKCINDTEKLEEWGRVSEVIISTNIKKKFDEILIANDGVYV
jgi:DNA repair exonuclease SbcCD nuclease subunit